MNFSQAAITVEPPLTPKYCVIWLHGLGDSGQGFAPILPEFKLGQSHHIRFLFPTAPTIPVTLNAGYIMPAWYDIKSPDLHDRADMSGVLASEQLIHQLIAEQIEQGIPSSRIILAGFSQGGVMSLFTGLRYPQPLAGILAMSCYLPSASSLPTELSEANKTTPIMQMHGTQDDVVPISAGEDAHRLLIEAGYNSQWQAYPMAHSVCLEQIQAISQWIQANCRA